jgi:hypothetical protein
MYSNGRSSSPSMASSSGSTRPPGCVSIPVEIVRESNSPTRHVSPFRTVHNENPYGVANSGVSASPPWNSPSTTSNNSTSRFLPRQSPNTAYSRLINNSEFNQPLYERPSYPQPQYRYPQQNTYEPSPLHSSRSSDDLLSTPDDMIRHSAQPQYSSMFPQNFSSGFGFRPGSDFLQDPTSKYTSPLRRSFDALNDYSDMHQHFPSSRYHPSEQQHQPQQQRQQQPYYRSSYQTQHQPQPTYMNQAFINPDIVYTNEHGAPMDHYQSTTASHPHDPSRSPASQRGASPARPQPPPPQQQQQQQQQQEPIPMPHHRVEEDELKMAKDTAGPIPMPPPASSSFAPSTDQQVPSTDTPTNTNAPSPQAAPAPVRDPNTIALEKLEQIKQNLADFDQQVDEFSGSTRNDRTYKLLDEQALKIMMRCDELVDVSPEIKEKRKEMIRNVQQVLTKLESKVPTTPGSGPNSHQMETTLAVYDSSANNNNALVDNNNGAQSENKRLSSSSPPKDQSSEQSTSS